MSDASRPADPARPDTGGSALLAFLAEQAGVDPDTERAQAAADILGRSRSAIANHGGHPNGAWSMREQLAVALVLDDAAHLAAMGYTDAEAARAVGDGMYFPPADMAGWLAGLRAQLDREAQP